MDGSKYMTFASQVLLKPVTVFTFTNVSSYVHVAILGTSAYGLAINMSPTRKFSPAQQNYNCIIPGPCEGTKTTTLKKFAIYSYQHNQAVVFSCYFDGNLDCSGKLITLILLTKIYISAITNLAIIYSFKVIMPRS